MASGIRVVAAIGPAPDPASTKRPSRGQRAFVGVRCTGIDFQLGVSVAQHDVLLRIERLQLASRSPCRARGRLHRVRRCPAGLACAPWCWAWCPASRPVADCFGIAEHALRRAQRPACGATPPAPASACRSRYPTSCRPDRACGLAAGAAALAAAVVGRRTTCRFSTWT